MNYIQNAHTLMDSISKAHHSLFHIMMVNLIGYNIDFMCLIPRGKQLGRFNLAFESKTCF